MPTIRSKGREVMVRYAGRRMRITTEWADVADEALERIHKAAAEQGDEIEEKSSSKKGESKSKSKKTREGESNDEAPSGRPEKE